MKDMLDLYDNIVDKTRYMTKRSLPLHRKLKNVYKQKIVFQVEIRKLISSLLLMKVILLPKDSRGNLRMQELKITN